MCATAKLSPKESEIVTLEITDFLKSLSLPCPGTGKTESKRKAKQLKESLTSFFPFMRSISIAFRKSKLE